MVYETFTVVSTDVNDRDFPVNYAIEVHSTLLFVGKLLDSWINAQMLPNLWAILLIYDHN